MRVTVCRKAHFNAAHRLYVKSWDDQKNDEISFNATQIEKIGIGRKMKKNDSLSLLLEEIQNNYSNYINTLDAINKEGSTATAKLLMDMV